MYVRGPQEGVHNSLCVQSNSSGGYQSLSKRFSGIKHEAASSVILFIMDDNIDHIY